MIIELYGLPASGKTTVAHKIAQKMGFEVVRITGRRELVVLSMLFCLKHPIFSLLTLYYISRNAYSWQLFYYKFMNCFLQHSAKYEKARRYSRALIDEGHWQNFIAIFETAQSRDVLMRYAKSIPNSDALFVFNVSRQELERRIIERGYFARNSFPPANVARWKEAIFSNDILLKQILADAGVFFTTVDAEKNQDEVADTVSAMLPRSNQPTVCFFGFYKPGYTRNRILLKGLRMNEVTVLECNSRKTGIAKYIELINKHRKLKKRYDIMFVAYPGYLSIILAKMITRKPIIFDAFFSIYDSVVHDRMVVKGKSIKGAYYWMLDWIACRLADIILLDTNTHIEHFIAVFGIPAKKFRRVLVGSDDDVMFPRRSLSVKEGGFLVHFHGGFNPMQGVEYIVEAAKILEHENITFQIIGRGQTFQETAARANDLKISNVIFYPSVSYEELGNYIRKADICLGIFGESLKAQLVIPNKVYEAIACGKAVITQESPAMRELFKDMVTCVFAKKADPGDIAEKILLLRDHPELREHIEQDGIRMFQQKLTPVQIGKSVKDILHEVTPAYL